jgi:hypothetical protein
MKFNPMKTLAALCLTLILAIGANVSRAGAQGVPLLGFPPGAFDNKAARDPQASGCSQATTAIARLDGSQNTAALTTMICGMVTDGTYSLLDGLWIFAINSLANAETNLASSSSYNLTTVGGTMGPLFTSNVGLSNNSDGSVANTNFNPNTAGGNFSLNSASVGVCDVTSRSSSTLGIAIGGYDGSSLVQIQPYRTGDVWYDINDGGFPQAANSNAQASYIVSRTSGPLLTVYVNGSSAGTDTSSVVSLLNVNIYIAGANGNGSVGQVVSDVLGYAFVGGGLTSTQANNLYSRLHTYMNTVSPGSGC